MPMLSDSIRSLSAAMIVAALVIAALVLGRDVLMPFALAIILAFILAPIVRFFTDRRVPHAAAVGFVVFSTLLVTMAGTYVFSNQLLSLTASLAGYKDNLAQKVRTITGSGSHDSVIRKAAASVDTLEKELKKETESPAIAQPSQQTVIVTREPASSNSLFDKLHTLAGPFATAGLMLLFTIFLLAQYHDIRDRVVRVAGIDNMADTTSALSDAGARLSRLFLLQAALNAGFGIFVGVALALIGVPNPVLWGVATCFLRFIPFVGSFLSAVPPILLAAAVDPGWGMVGATLALYLISEPLLGHVVEPLVLGRGVGLSSFAMVAAASFWTLIWGPIGLILAAPLTMSLVVLGQYIPQLEIMSVLLGDTPALTPEEEFYHRLLSDDAAAAANQFEVAATTSNAGLAADTIALPALRIAARDLRNERLDAAQTATVRDTMESVIGFVVDELTSASPTGAETDRADRQHVLVVPARGPVDTIAARFVAAVVSAQTHHYCTAVEQASGLMALSAARDYARDAPVDAIILSTVGGIEHQHLRLIERRARRDFPAARLLVCDWSAVQDDATTSKPAVDKQVSTLPSLSSVIEVLSYARKAAPATKDAASGAAATPVAAQPQLSVA